MSSIHVLISIITVGQPSGEGYIFSRVCLSLHRGFLCRTRPLCTEPKPKPPDIFKLVQLGPHTPTQPHPTPTTHISGHINTCS